MFGLGDGSLVAPAAVYIRDDGGLVTGDAAARRAVSNPDRVAREIKRNLGNPTPVMLGGAPYAVSDLLGALLQDVLARAAERQGAKPDVVALTHPANWGPFRKSLFEDVARSAGLTDPLYTTEPEAAAAHYASTRPLGEGDVLAVYDLGGGTFDATVLRRTADGFEIVGTPEGIERLGGADFDEAVFAHVNYVAGGALTELDMSDPKTVVALARLRQDCVLAKEALSVDVEATIPVFLPNRHFDVHPHPGRVRGHDPRADRVDDRHPRPGPARGTGRPDRAGRRAAGGRLLPDPAGRADDLRGLRPADRGRRAPEARRRARRGPARRGPRRSARGAAAGADARRTATGRWPPTSGRPSRWHVKRPARAGRGVTDPAGRARPAALAAVGRRRPTRPPGPGPPPPPRDAAVARRPPPGRRRRADRPTTEPRRRSRRPPAWRPGSGPAPSGAAGALAPDGRCRRRVRRGRVVAAVPRAVVAWSVLAMRGRRGRLPGHAAGRPAAAASRRSADRPAARAAAAGDGGADPVPRRDDPGRGHPGLRRRLPQRPAALHRQPRRRRGHRGRHRGRTR